MHNCQESQKSNIMEEQDFTIKVAIIGNGGVGKTTILKALLQGKLRTIPLDGINWVQILSPPPAPAQTQQQTQPAASDDESSNEKRYTTTTFNGIVENGFDVQLNEPLCEMRRDTRLIIVDIPGLNEAGSDEKKNQQYVTNSWRTFDCAIVVLTEDEGNEEQLELLTFVKKKRDESKNIPIFVLCNKVDDAEDKESMMRVGKVREKVEEIFQVGSRTESLNRVLKASEKRNRVCNDGGDAFPIFLPLSAGNAFAYRIAASSSIETFKQLDFILIDKLGRDQVGRFQWKKLSTEEKYKVAFDAVGDADHYKESLKATNFDMFLTLFAYAIGGHQVQCHLLKKQMEVSLGRLSLSHDPMLGRELHGLNGNGEASKIDTTLAKEKCMSLRMNAQVLRCIHRKGKAIKMNTTLCKEKFWQLYSATAEAVYTQLEHVMDPSPFSALMEELVVYNDFVHQVGCTKEEGNVIVAEMEGLVRRFISIILQMEHKWKIGGSDLGYFKCEYVCRTDDSCWYKTADNSLYPFKGYPPKNYPWHWERDANGWRNVYTQERKGGHSNPGSHRIPDWLSVWARDTICIAHGDDRVRGSGHEVTVKWKQLTYHDWVTILSSLLLLSHSPHFYERFSHEKTLVEKCLRRQSFYSDCLATAATESEKNALFNTPIFIQGTYVDGTFVPKDPLMFRTVYQVVNPKLLSDPSHWGHLIWKFCKYMDKMD